MKTKKKTVRVKAWCYLSKDYKPMVDSSSIKESGSFYSYGCYNRPHDSYPNAIPCTITYTLPRRKRP